MTEYNHSHVRHATGSHTIAWLAFLLSIIALILAWLAYDRTGGDLSADLQNRAAVAQEQADQRFERLEARMRLINLRANVTGNTRQDESAREIAAIRAELQETYRDAQGEAREFWQRLDAELQQLENFLRERSNKAAEQLQRAIDRLNQ